LLPSPTPTSPAISKSLNGLPNPRFPQGVNLKVEAQRSRRRLYPVTILYSAYSLTVLSAALLSGRNIAVVLAFFLAGIGAWTYVEYLAHRYILHGRFPAGEGFLRRFLHARFDHLHYEHHERPWDGDHINGTISDTLPVVAFFALLSFLAPLHTAPVLVAGLLQAYIAEEWVHHSVHFYNFRGRYFRYIKRHHLYHHSPQGSEVGFGLTNGIWDVLRHTRIPAEARALLYGRPAPSRAAR
jgi:sterol desaturase/sphingolipid hydroxylase (fatty acid hydroxylase superfamily)